MSIWDNDSCGVAVYKVQNTDQYIYFQENEESIDKPVHLFVIGKTADGYAQLFIAPGLNQLTFSSWVKLFNLLGFKRMTDEKFVSDMAVAIAEKDCLFKDVIISTKFKEKEINEGNRHEIFLQEDKNGFVTGARLLIESEKPNECSLLNIKHPKNKQTDRGVEFYSEAVIVVDAPYGAIEKVLRSVGFEVGEEAIDKWNRRKSK